VASYFTKSLLLRILIANAIGTFCLAVQHGDLSSYSVINLGTYTGSDSTTDIFVNRVEEIPLYMIMGVVFGMLGGAFCWSFMFLRRNFTDKMPAPGTKKRAIVQLMEVALLSILTSVCIFYLPAQKWACKPRKIFSENEQRDFTEQSYVAEHKERFFCSEGEVNELANILFGSRIDAIKRILADPTQFNPETLLTVGCVFYVLSTLTFGVELPSGIFTPSVLIGASLGGAAGIGFNSILDSDIEPSTFALLGVAGLLAGIQRSTVSLVVILVEGTGQIKVLTPSIIVVVISRYVASLIHKKGIFEAVMEWKKLPYLAHESKRVRSFLCIVLLSTTSVYHQRL
jgi:H+/Cl- antiporter ClcA